MCKRTHLKLGFVQSRLCQWNGVIVWGDTLLDNKLRWRGMVGWLALFLHLRDKILAVNHLSGHQLWKTNMNKILSLFSALLLVYILVFSEMTRDPGDLVAPLCWMEEILESLSLRSRTSSSLVLPWVWFLHYEKLSFQLLTVSPDVNCWAHWVIQ